MARRKTGGPSVMALLVTMTGVFVVIFLASAPSEIKIWEKLFLWNSNFTEATKTLSTREPNTAKTITETQYDSQTKIIQILPESSEKSPASVNTRTFSGKTTTFNRDFYFDNPETTHGNDVESSRRGTETTEVVNVSK